MNHDNVLPCARDIVRALADDLYSGVARTSVRDLLRTLQSWRLAEVFAALDWLASERWIEHDAALSYEPDDEEPAPVRHANNVWLSAFIRREGAGPPRRHEQCRAEVLAAIEHLPRIAETDPDYCARWCFGFRVDDLCRVLPSWKCDRSDVVEALDRLHAEGRAVFDGAEHSEGKHAYSFFVVDVRARSRSAGKAVTR